MEAAHPALSDAARASLMEAVAQIGGTGPVPVVVISNAYADWLDNWMYYMEALGIGRFLVVATDAALAGRLARAGIPAARCDFAGSTLGFWLYRLLIWDCLIDRGIDIIQSDVDAIWFKNPIDKYFDESKYDLVWTQGTLHPRRILAHWGFILCTGLFWAKAGAGTRAFFAALRSRAAAILATTDQAVINQLLYDEGTTWNIAGAQSYPLDWQGHPFTGFEGVLEGHCPAFGLRLAMLPYRLFPRSVTPGGGAYVKHLQFPRPPGEDRVPEERLAQMREAGCWILDQRPTRL
ncbi:MAG: putative nucleotide-diphospho-sugar transferase [Alphaproteobacteria bacterium]